MARYLLDTNVFSEPLKAAPRAKLVRRLEARQGEIATAAPVWHELLFGCNRLPASKRRARIERYLSEVVWPFVPVLPYDASAARWHATERARLAALGKTPTFVDGQIAAIAYVNDLTLVTENRADFADFDGLQVEDWSR